MRRAGPITAVLVVLALALAAAPGAQAQVQNPDECKMPVFDPRDPNDVLVCGTALADYLWSYQPPPPPSPPPPPKPPVIPGAPTECQPSSTGFNVFACPFRLVGPLPPIPPVPNPPPVPPSPVPVPQNPDDCKMPIFSPTDPGDVERCAGAWLDEVQPGACNSLDKLDCPDHDGDGVDDRYDSCPAQYGNTPNGCPDTDGDGIEDRADQCPSQAGVRPHGCPDRDGDGVRDSA